MADQMDGMVVWLVAATSYYDDPVVHHIAATEAAATAWAEAQGGLKGLAGGYDYTPAVVLGWIIGSEHELEPAIARLQRTRG